MKQPSSLQKKIPLGYTTEATFCQWQEKGCMKVDTNMPTESEPEAKCLVEKGESIPSVVYSKEEARAKRLENIKDQIESNQTQLGFLERGKEKAVASGQYGQAAVFEQQGVDLKIKLRKLKSEKRELQIKCKSLKKRRERRKSGLKTRGQ